MLFQNVLQSLEILSNILQPREALRYMLRRKQGRNILIIIARSNKICYNFIGNSPGHLCITTSPFTLLPLPHRSHSVAINDGNNSAIPPPPPLALTPAPESNGGNSLFPRLAIILNDPDRSTYPYPSRETFIVSAVSLDHGGDTWHFPPLAYAYIG